MNQFSYKVARRLKYYSKFLIPYNLKYKLVGVYPTIEEFVANNPDKGSFKEIFPAHTSRIEIDKEFFDACPFYIKPNMEINQPASKIVRIKDGRVISGVLGTHIAYISSNNHLIGEVSFQYANDKVLPPEKNNILQYKYFESPKKYEGKVFSMLSGAGGEFNYFHWFFDTMPKLYLAKKAKWFDSIDWFLVPSYKYKFQKEYLSLLGIDENKIIRGDQTSHLQADELIVPTATRGSDKHIPLWICDFFKKTILPKVVSKPIPKKRVYVSRNDSDKRKVLNEDELIIMLKKYGFEFHQLNNKSMKEQIELFASASFIVSPHGAGLSNLVFCEAGSKVIEFFPGGYVKQTYYDLSNKLKLDYQYIIFEKNEEANNSLDGQKIHITADIAQIEKNIVELLN